MNKAEARKFLRDVVGDISLRFCDATKEELETLLEVVNAWTPTNCWFAEYWMKNGLINLIEGKLQDMRLAAKEK